MAIAHALILISLSTKTKSAETPIKRCHRILQRTIGGYVAGYLIHYARILSTPHMQVSAVSAPTSAPGELSLSPSLLLSIVFLILFTIDH